MVRSPRVAAAAAAAKEQEVEVCSETGRHAVNNQSPSNDTPGSPSTRARMPVEEDAGTDDVIAAPTLDGGTASLTARAASNPGTGAGTTSTITSVPAPPETSLHHPSPPGAVFEVWCDGRMVWRSRPVFKPKDIVECAVNVLDVQELELRIYAIGDHGSQRGTDCNVHVFGAWLNASANPETKQSNWLRSAESSLSQLCLPQRQRPNSPQFSSVADAVSNFASVVSQHTSVWMRLMRFVPTTELDRRGTQGNPATSFAFFDFEEPFCMEVSDTAFGGLAQLLERLCALCQQAAPNKETLEGALATSWAVVDQLLAAFVNVAQVNLRRLLVAGIDPIDAGIVIDTGIALSSSTTAAVARNNALSIPRHLSPGFAAIVSVLQTIMSFEPQPPSVTTNNPTMPGATTPPARLDCALVGPQVLSAAERTLAYAEAICELSVSEQHQKLQGLQVNVGESIDISPLCKDNNDNPGSLTDEAKSPRPTKTSSRTYGIVFEVQVQWPVFDGDAVDGRYEKVLLLLQLLAAQKGWYVWSGCVMRASTHVCGMHVSLGVGVPAGCNAR